MTRRERDLTCPASLARSSREKPLSSLVQSDLSNLSNLVQKFLAAGNTEGFSLPGTPLRFGQKLTCREKRPSGRPSLTTSMFMGISRVRPPPPSSPSLTRRSPAGPLAVQQVDVNRCHHRCVARPQPRQDTCADMRRKFINHQHGSALVYQTP